MAQSNTSTFLCADTLINTMLFLQPRAIVKCSAISQQFYKCSKSNILWKAIYEQLFMENLFGWRLQMVSGDDEEKVNESSESGDDSDEYELEKEKSFKKLKSEQDDDMYWFNLFRETLSFPKLDMKFTNIKEDADDSMDSIRKITDVERLYDIIQYLKNSHTFDEYNVPVLCNYFRINFMREFFMRIKLA